MYAVLPKIHRHNDSTSDTKQIKIKQLGHIKILVNLCRKQDLCETKVCNLQYNNVQYDFIKNSYFYGYNKNDKCHILPYEISCRETPTTEQLTSSSTPKVSLFYQIVFVFNQRSL